MNEFIRNIVYLLPASICGSDLYLPLLHHSQPESPPAPLPQHHWGRWPRCLPQSPDRRRASCTFRISGSTCTVNPFYSLDLSSISLHSLALFGPPSAPRRLVWSQQAAARRGDPAVVPTGRTEGGGVEGFHRSKDSRGSP